MGQVGCDKPNLLCCRRIQRSRVLCHNPDPRITRFLNSDVRKRGGRSTVGPSARDIQIVSSNLRRKDVDGETLDTFTDRGNSVVSIRDRRPLNGLNWGQAVRQDILKDTKGQNIVKGFR